MENDCSEIKKTESKDLVTVRMRLRKQFRMIPKFLAWAVAGSNP